MLYWYRSYNLPPGPWGVPLLGYLPFAWKKDFVLLATQLGKKYGNVFSLTSGTKVVIILNDYEAMKDAFVKQGTNFNGRPPGLKIFPGKTEKGILMDEGESWQQHRRFVVSILRELGMGKQSIEPKIQEEIQHCVNEFEKFSGNAMDPKPVLEVSILNVIATMAFGKRFDYNDDKLKHMISLSEEVGKLVGTFRLQPVINALMWIPFLSRLTGITRLQEIRREFEDFNYMLINSQKETPSEDHGSSYIGAYLKHRDNLIKQNGDEGYFDVSYLEGTLSPLFTAGRETTSSTLRWAILYMVANPSVQSKVQTEIGNVVGSERQPSMNDRPLMPYTEATLMEIHRLGSVVPMSIVHSNMAEATILGQKIPKRCIVIPNLYAVHHNEKLWDDVKCFKPERFIDKNGLVQKSEYLIPFSIGKRACLAESLARMEVFLYFTSLLQRFTFCSETSNTNLSFEHESGIIRSPCSFKVRAIPNSVI